MPRSLPQHSRRTLPLGHGASLRSIAESVNLTEAGVLHYFHSKDDLLVEILATRDRADLEAFDLSTTEGVWPLIERAVATPGLVKLLLDMTAASTSPEHPTVRCMRSTAMAVGRQTLALLTALDTECVSADQLNEAAIEAFQQQPDHAIVTSVPGLGEMTGTLVRPGRR